MQAKRRTKILAFLKLLAVAGLGLYGSSRIAKVVKDELRSMEPAPAVVTEDLRYPAQAVSFPTEDGLTLVGSFVPSQNGATIVLVHGYAGNRRQLEDVAQFLIAAGYGVFSYDTRAHGESEGQVIGYGVKETKDLHAALDFIEAQGADMKKVGVFGFSLGAFIAARTAAHEDRLHALVLSSVPQSAWTLAMDSDGGGLKGFISGTIRLVVDEAMGVSAFGLGLEDQVAYLSPKPVLFVGGLEDKAVPPKRIEELYRLAAQPKFLEIYAGSAHGDYRKLHAAQFQKLVLDFYAKSLFPASTAQLRN